MIIGVYIFWKKLKNKLRYNRKRSLLVIFFILLACSLGVGYAFFQTELSIEGTSKFHYLADSSGYVRAGTLSNYCEISGSGQAICYDLGPE